MENKGVNILTHASAFFAPYLVPVLVFLLVQDKMVKRIAIQSVLFQLILGVLIAVSSFFSVFLIGIPFLIGFGIMWLVVPIIGIVKTLQGDHYEYPIVKHFF